MFFERKGSEERRKKRKKGRKKNLDGVCEGLFVFDGVADDNARRSVKELDGLIGWTSVAIGLPQLDTDHDTIDREVLLERKKEKKKR